VRMERPPWLQNEPVPASLGVGELDLIARGEQAAGLPDHAGQANAAPGLLRGGG
jgi:hypothetical protein